jgi:pyruvate dehydrogenase E2 component (dihydrolipoamide acetyltransferase)
MSTQSRACTQNADSTDIYQLSRNWADLVKRARAKQLAPDEYQSGNFTISNLGMFGVTTFDAILPPGGWCLGLQV